MRNKKMLMSLMIVALIMFSCVALAVAGNGAGNGADKEAGTNGCKACHYGEGSFHHTPELIDEYNCLFCHNIEGNFLETNCRVCHEKQIHCGRESESRYRFGR